MEKPFYEICVAGSLLILVENMAFEHGICQVDEGDIFKLEGTSDVM